MAEPFDPNKEFQYFVYNDSIKAPNSKRELTMEFYKMLGRIDVGKNGIESIHCAPGDPNKSEILVEVRYNELEKCLDFTQNIQEQFERKFVDATRRLVANAEYQYIHVDFYQGWLT